MYSVNLVPIWIKKKEARNSVCLPLEHQNRSCWCLVVSWIHFSDPHFSVWKCSIEGSSVVLSHDYFSLWNKGWALREISAWAWTAVSESFLNVLNERVGPFSSWFMVLSFFFFFHTECQTICLVGISFRDLMVICLRLVQSNRFIFTLHVIAPRDSVYIMLKGRYLAVVNSIAKALFY